MDHEFQEHRRTFQWACNLCPGTRHFPSVQLFEDHLTKYHLEEISTRQISELVLASRYSIPRGAETEICPFCEMHTGTTRNKFRAHLGKHLLQISLACISGTDQVHEEDTSEDDSEDGGKDREGQDGPVTYSSLLKDLSTELLEWPERENKYFLPVDQFKRLITVDSIATELRESGKKLDSEDVYQQTAQLIFERYSKLFVILLLIDRLNCIYDFIDAETDDSHLPFQKMGHGFFSKQNPDLQIQCTKDWSWAAIREFSSRQWSLNAPIFEKDGHYVLDNNDIMPFTMDASRGSTTMPHGAFGEVNDIVIHRAHQFLRTPGDAKVSDSHFNHSQILTDVKTGVRTLRNQKTLLPR